MSQDHNHLNHDMGVQVPCRVHTKVPQEVAVWANPTALGQCIPRARPAQGMPDRGRALDVGSCAHADINPAAKYSVSEVIGYLKGKSSIWIAQNVERKLRNFLGHKFWARGYFVSTIGRDEEMIRAYIRNQEMADKQLD